MKKIFFIYLCLCNIIFALNFSVAPTGFNLDLKNNQTNEVYLINNTAKPLRIEIFTETPKSYEKYNFDDKIVIFPKIISIKPGGKQTVRFKIKTNNIKEDGEYKSLLIFREKPSELKTEVVEKSTELSTSISFITELAIGVVGHIGKGNIDGSIKDVKVNYRDNYLDINAKVLSKGNTSMKIYYLIQDENGNEISSGKYGNSLRNGENILNNRINVGNIKGKDIKLILFNQKEKIIFQKNLKF